MAEVHEERAGRAPAGGIPVSYAQNGEDVVLARAFGEHRGFYVDVGAFDPELESVTKLFYDRGWRGINVDPVAPFVDRFDMQRPRDVNVCAAVGKVDGEAELWISPSVLPGHSTLDAGIARSHADDGLAFERRRVHATTLDTLLDRCVPPGQEIDFLKIDVEGAEEEVLAGWDAARWRPRVVVVECFAPYVAGSTHDRWEHRLLEGGYSHVLFDGLNRFYVRDGDPELSALLSAPVNVFDEYETIEHLRMRTAMAAMEADLTALRGWATSLVDRVTFLEARLSGAAEAPAGRGLAGDGGSSSPGECRTATAPDA